MPQLNIPQIRPNREDVRIGLWQMTETPAALLEEYPALARYAGELSAYKSEAKRQEFLSVRALLYGMEGKMPDVAHNAAGKPSLAGGGNISVSHTRGYAAVILSDSHNVAIDIEYASDRVCRIADRFLRSDEKPRGTAETLLCWCAKETLYKLHSEDRLTFSDMRVGRIGRGGQPLPRSGQFTAENLKRSAQVLMSYTVTDMFVMTYAAEKNV